MENYTPDVGYSASDYHHVRPLALTKTYSTCHFPQPKSKTHGRQVSRFTVISNAAETEKSYDPFKASRPQHLDAVRPADRATVTIHRSRNQEDKVTIKERLASRASVNSGSERGRPRKLIPPRPYASRSSLASSTRSRGSAPYVRATVGHPRGVSFSHLRRRSPSAGARGVVSADPHQTSNGRHSNHTEVTDDGGDSLRPVGGTPASTRYIRSRKAQSAASQPPLPTVGAKSGRGSQIWTEDVRQLSSSLAKDCDEAFNRSTVASNCEALEKVTGGSSAVVGTNQKLKRSILDTRPLPPPPSRSDSVKVELLEARKQAELRKASGEDVSLGYLDRMVSHIDRLIEPTSPVQAHPERRTSSAPVEKKHLTSGRLLPSIYEGGGEDVSPRGLSDFSNTADSHRHAHAKSGRTASAPEPRVAHKTYLDDRFSRPDSDERDTIRVVNPSSPRSPVKPPAPLTIRKKGGLNSDHAHQRRPSISEPQDTHRAGVNLNDKQNVGRMSEDRRADEPFAHNSSSGTIVQKTSNWFKRNSRSSEDGFKTGTRGKTSQSSSNNTMAQHLDANLPMASKTKGFSLRRLFKKRDSKPDMTVSRKYNAFHPFMCAMSLISLQIVMFLTTTKQVLRIRLLKPAAPAHHTSTIMQITTTYECGRSSHSKTGSPSFSM